MTFDDAQKRGVVNMVEHDPLPPLPAQSQTPLTDAKERAAWNTTDGAAVLIGGVFDFARTLETALAAAKEKWEKERRDLQFQVKMAKGEVSEVIAEIYKAAEQRDALAEKLRRASEKQPINTHVRLFDLVRFMRRELHDADLIDDDEYAWLCLSPMSTAPEGGSPSPRRLEDYDALRTKLRELGEQLEGAKNVLQTGLDRDRDDKDTLLVLATVAVNGLYWTRKELAALQQTVGWAVALLDEIEDRFCKAESSYEVSSDEDWLIKEVAEFKHRLARQPDQRQLP